jgi:hypothetical protein
MSNSLTPGPLCVNNRMWSCLSSLKNVPINRCVGVFPRILYIKNMCLRLWMVVIVVTAVTGTAVAEWGGYVNANALSSRVDTVTTQIIDQQYQFYLNSVLLPTLSYYATARFRNVQTQTTGSPFDWHREVEPTLTATWSNPLLTMTGTGLYRESRDRSNAGGLVGRSLSLYAQTLPHELPRVFGQLLFERNVNNLDLLGLDTRQRNLSAGADYTHKMLHLRYDFSDALTTNENSRLEVSSQQHTGHAEYGIHLFRRALSVQSTYEITARHEREQQPGSGNILLPLTVVAGLYAADPTPDFGALDPQPSIVDGDISASAGADLDLSSAAYLNLGLDVGTAVQMDHLYLYTDTLANPSLLWAIYASNDNQTWTSVIGDRAYPFSVPFLRYEIAFPAQTTRYIKIVMQPQPQSRPVHVTELRAFITQGEHVEDSRPVNQRGSLDVRVQPAKWLSVGATGWLQETGRSQLQQERQQNNATGTLSMPVHRLLNFSGRYQFSRITYAQASSHRAQTEQVSSAWNAEWLSTLTTRASFFRNRELIGEQLVRRLDGTSLQMMALIFPQLRSVSEIGQTEDHRFAVADNYRTRTFRESVDSRPTAHSTVSAQYRYERFTSLQGRVPTRRETVTLDGGYDVTATIAMRGGASFYREGSNHVTSWNGTASWNPLPRLSVTSGYSSSEIPHGGSNDLITADASFRPLATLELQAGASHGRYTQDSHLNNTNVRLGANLRF